MPYKDESIARTHVTYYAMLSRCSDPKHQNFPHYGGRGIQVCDRWRDSFRTFLADMGVRPAGHQLDRIDGGGNYEPGNCRWVTPSQNSRTRSPSAARKEAGKRNIRAAKLAWIAQQRARTHCLHGHEFTQENTYLKPNGTRCCKQCKWDRIRASRAAQKAARKAA